MINNGSGDLVIEKFADFTGVNAWELLKPAVNESAQNIYGLVYVGQDGPEKKLLVIVGDREFHGPPSGVLGIAEAYLGSFTFANGSDQNLKDGQLAFTAIKDMVNSSELLGPVAPGFILPPSLRGR